MNVQSTRYADLDCQVVDCLAEGQPPTRVVILCHGFGAPGTDLVPLGAELFSMTSLLSVGTRFVFPAAPLSLDAVGMYGSRAWWMLDVVALNAAIETGEFRDLSSDVPDGMAAASDQVLKLVTEIQQQSDLLASHIVLGGFSQGSMLTTDVALRMPDPPAALIVLSGTLVCQDIWKQRAARRGRLRVFQSHGRQDPILPFLAAQWLRDMFSDAGLQNEFLAFDGVHTIPVEALKRVAAILEELL